MRAAEAGELAHLDLTPYSGCWIAVVDGRVVGVGRTARAARAAAKRSRPKDDPVVVWITPDGRVRGQSGAEASHGATGGVE